MINGILEGCYAVACTLYSNERTVYWDEVRRLMLMHCAFVFGDIICVLHVEFV